ncbi:MAG: antibiotic biosynthesis monooxygenase [Bacteroidia bacterium]|nr:antibiotic biosynthesis monooxygenase [Bacteroidia bacterium]
MITRIVRMEFDPEKVEDFLALFEQNKSLIRHFPGVLHLELHRDAQLPHVFYTWSVWQSPADLETYRHSELFNRVWTRTKAMFAGKPSAFSLEKVMEVL